MRYGRIRRAPKMSDRARVDPYRDGAVPVEATIKIVDDSTSAVTARGRPSVPAGLAPRSASVSRHRGPSRRRTRAAPALLCGIAETSSQDGRRTGPSGSAVPGRRSGHSPAGDRMPRSCSRPSHETPAAPTGPASMTPCENLPSSILAICLSFARSSIGGALNSRRASSETVTASSFTLGWPKTFGGVDPAPERPVGEASQRGQVPRAWLVSLIRTSSPPRRRVHWR